RPTVESSSSPRTDQRAAKPTVTPSTPSVRASKSDSFYGGQISILVDERNPSRLVVYLFALKA
ncbi:hypothetical protein ACFC5Z_42195, partial [Streptomyces sp. NPDC056004]|uniref:hypothetical protein n=1 Tax=Streptomyces sp. NPDC056004 TaxID=3345677 RepID=UPI0035D9DE76